MRRRAPLILSAAALVIALLGSTPLGGAARDVVPFALFARNSGKVDGIPASRTPKAGRLLPLGTNRKFPLSVLPPGTRGPEGRQGPVGPQGPAGPPATKLWAVVNPDGTLYEGSGVRVAQRYDLGEYQVAFNRNVDECAAVASVGAHQAGAGGSSDVGLGWANTYTHGITVTVLTRIPGGFNPFQTVDRGFNLAVFC